MLYEFKERLTFKKVKTSILEDFRENFIDQAYLNTRKDYFALKNNPEPQSNTVKNNNQNR